MIYRVHLWDGVELSMGFEYFKSKKAAEARLAEWIGEDPEVRSGSDIQKHPTPSSLTDIVALLNKWGGHPDNG